MRAQDFISKCVELSQSFQSWQDSDYIDFMQENFRVYEAEKPKSVDDTLRRLKLHYDKGFFDRPKHEAPLFLCD